jgi:hypothetical protein
MTRAIAGVLDELTLDVVPVLLGSGERIFDGVESFGFEPVEVLHSPLATHIRYRPSLPQCSITAVMETQLESSVRRPLSTS